jgi:excisionase family DNA binding protein
MDDRTELTVDEAAGISGYAAGHIRWLIRNDKIAARRIGHRVYLVNLESLQAYLATVEELGTKKHSRNK